MGDYDRLSDLGHQQAKRTGEAFRHLAPVHRFLAGTLKRHQQTAGAFADTFGALPVLEQDARWNELDHVNIIQAALDAGIHASTSSERGTFPSFFGLATGRWASGAHDADYTESYAAFQGRVSQAFDQLASELAKGETALVVTSGGVISAVVRHILGLPPEVAFRINTTLVNAGMTRIQVGRGQATLSSLNVDLHLVGDHGLLTYA